MQQAKDSSSRSNMLISRLSCCEIQGKSELLHYDGYIGFYVGRHSSVGIATCYRLDGPEIESRLEKDFPRPSRPALGPTQRPVEMESLLSPGLKQPGRGVDYPPHLTPRLQKEESQLLPPFVLSRPVRGYTLHLT